MPSVNADFPHARTEARGGPGGRGAGGPTHWHQARVLLVKVPETSSFERERQVTPRLESGHSPPGGLGAVPVSLGRALTARGGYGRFLRHEAHCAPAPMGLTVPGSAHAIAQDAAEVPASVSGAVPMRDLQVTVAAAGTGSCGLHSQAPAALGLWPRRCQETPSPSPAPTAGDGVHCGMAPIDIESQGPGLKQAGGDHAGDSERPAACHCPSMARNSESVTGPAPECALAQWTTSGSALSHARAGYGPI